MNKVAYIRKKMMKLSKQFYMSDACFDKDEVENHKLRLLDLLTELISYRENFNFYAGKKYIDLLNILKNATTNLKVMKKPKNWDKLKEKLINGKNSSNYTG